MNKHGFYRITVGTLFIAVVLGLCGCDQDKKSLTNQVVVDAQKVSEISTDGLVQSAVNDRKPQSEAEKISYMLGVTLAHGVSPDVVQLDKDFVALGVSDVVNRKTMKIRESELQKILYQYNLAMEANKSRRASELEKEHGIQTALIKSSGEQFLLSNRQQDGVIEAASGLQYKLIKAGSGISPTLNDSVKVHYSASFIDGEKLQEFDSSYKRNEPASFLVKEVIPGWQEILPLMKEGDRYQVVVPARLGYGIPGITGGEIPMTATLVYELELVDVISGLESAQ